MIPMNIIRKSRLFRDTRGANMVEYIIMVGLVALIALIGFKMFGEKVQKKIQDQSTAVEGINASGG